MKFTITYIAPPISEIPKQTTIEVPEQETLSFEQASHILNIERSKESKPPVEVNDIIKVVESHLD